jgi:hypothetical protein
MDTPLAHTLLRATDTLVTISAFVITRVGNLIAIPLVVDKLGRSYIIKHFPQATTLYEDLTFWLGVVYLVGIAASFFMVKPLAIRFGSWLLWRILSEHKPLELTRALSHSDGNLRIRELEQLIKDTLNPIGVYPGRVQPAPDCSNYPAFARAISTYYSDIKSTEIHA